MKKVISILFVALFATQLTAQSISDLVNDTTLSYYAIKKKIKDNPKYFENASEKELKFFNRWDWYWRSRVDKNGSMKAADKAMRKFLKEYKKEQDTHKATPLNRWEPRGPWNSTLGSDGWSGDARIGRVGAIWVDPDDHNIILIGAHGNGIWKTTNGGTNWHRLNPDIPGGVTSIAVEPNNKNKIYITTGTHTSGYEKNIMPQVFGKVTTVDKHGANVPTRFN